MAESRITNHSRQKNQCHLNDKSELLLACWYLTGVILSWLVNPAFIGLSVFVGARFVLAGITDSYVMGMMLAKLPWNQVSQTH